MIHDPTRLYLEASAEGLRPERVLSVWEWANSRRILTEVSSREAGKYRTDRTPYLKEIMDCMSVHDPTTEIVIIKGTQVGGTEIANNFVGYIIDVAPGPTLYMLPTVELAQEHSKNRIAPMIEKTPELTKKVSPVRSRDGGNTVLSKQFLGGALYLAGSNSGASYRSKSIRYLILDDIDGFVLDVEGEGNPINLAEKRTDTYSSRKKIIKISTPTEKGSSLVAVEYETSDQRGYHVHCPFCDGLQTLEWGGKGEPFGIKFEVAENQVTDCWYVCRKCGARIDEHYKTQMLAGGVWIPKYPERTKRGYHISGFMSPAGFVSWRQIASEFWKAKDNIQSIKVWVNTRKGEVYDEPGIQPEWTEIKARAEAYEALTVPLGGLLLTAGVDVQDDRLAVVVRAWGLGEESWLVWYGEIYGDTSQDMVWSQLDQILYRTFDRADGAGLRITSAGVDSGGHRTQEVYNYCRTRTPIVFALKGASIAAKPVIGRPTSQDVTWQGKKIENGVQLWPVGTDTAKAVIYSRLKMTDTGPGRYHQYIGLADEYYLQLTAERLVTRFKDGYPYREWQNIRPGGRNEVIDTEVYAYAAAMRAGLPWISGRGLASTKGKKRTVVKSRFMER
jgi:phage terminase large subunit GpA-like protein